jgi:hypothetical protein
VEGTEAERAAAVQMMVVMMVMVMMEAVAKARQRIGSGWSTTT